jgi:hypothetical protein
MKQFFLSAALLIGTALSFTACNNGAYDMDPDTNNSGVGNPFSSANGGVTVGAGTIQFKANGNLKTFNVGGGAVLASNVMTMGANTSATAPWEVAQLTINPFSSTGAYEDNGDNVIALTYAKVTNPDNGFDFIYGSGNTSSGAKINVVVDDGSVVKGTFTAKIWNNIATPDTLWITDGQFNLPRK